MANANEVPLGIERTLFAVDIVSFYLNTRYPHFSSRICNTEVAKESERYREFAVKRFDGHIKRVMSFIDWHQAESVEREFVERIQNDNVNVASLLDYTETYKSWYGFAIRYDARAFLLCCSRIAAMACNFYSHGVPNSLDLGIDIIKSAFPDDTDTNSSTWNSLKKVASYTLTNDDFLRIFKPPPQMRRHWIFPDPVIDETEESDESSATASGTAADPKNLSATSTPETLTAGLENLNISDSDTGYTTYTEHKVYYAYYRCSANNYLTHLLESITANAAARAERAAKDDGKIASSSKGKTTPDTSSGNILEPSSSKPCLGKRASPSKLPPCEESSAEIEMSEDSMIKKLKLSESGETFDKSSSHKSCLGKRLSPRKQESLSDSELETKQAKSPQKDSSTKKSKPSESD